MISLFLQKICAASLQMSNGQFELILSVFHTTNSSAVGTGAVVSARTPAVEDQVARVDVNHFTALVVAVYARVLHFAIATMAEARGRQEEFVSANAKITTVSLQQKVHYLDRKIV